ncbi:MAG: hypothetical protein IJ202_10375 [Bacteroidales bacterium]|jgi:hypothetical protein|nr:hypothetical protein [Bacteroidales bacterium]MBQ9174690.1 hypothetical protein [Bacteroidales bacterium]MBQ9713439.1 hypothetical protein [Bacteroidales bacterium]MBR1436326.1 hypothetical protein [Bacteroidales bacterium]MBR6415592.1 hypothetical protein [Bacteroidales bacterium]
MLEGIKKSIERLIARYESERSERIALEEEVKRLQALNEVYGKRITELERQVENLKLTEAFTGSSPDKSAAKEKIDKLIREIDKCISLLEK